MVQTRTHRTDNGRPTSVVAMLKGEARDYAVRWYIRVGRPTRWLVGRAGYESRVAQDPVTNRRLVVTDLRHLRSYRAKCDLARCRKTACEAAGLTLRAMGIGWWAGWSKTNRAARKALAEDLIDLMLHGEAE